jgi:DNA-binding IclR family transcriptional regulator
MNLSAIERDLSVLFNLMRHNNITILNTHNVGVTLRLGNTSPLTYSAPGKAIVAFLPEKEREELLAQDNLFFHGESINLDREKLARELDECRYRGFAEASGKRSPLVRILASPVLGPKARPVGVLLIIGIFPKTAVTSLGEKLSEAARQLSVKLGSDATWPSISAVKHTAKVHGQKL